MLELAYSLVSKTRVLTDMRVQLPPRPHMYLLFVPFLFLLLALIIFAFPRFSPIPYFPANKKDLPLILKALDIAKNHVVIDLGAGDGLVIFKAASVAYQKKLNTQFIAVEVNPVLVFILQIRRLLHPNKSNIRILHADLFTLNLHSLIFSHKSLITVYLYVSPWFLEKITSKLKKELKKFRLVSYFYSLPHKKPLKKFNGIHTTYSYTFP